MDLGSLVATLLISRLTAAGESPAVDAAPPCPVPWWRGARAISVRPASRRRPNLSPREKKTVQHFSITVDTKEQLEDVKTRLWDKLGVRGEIQVRRLDGKYRIDVISERDLAPSQLEKLPGKHA